MLLSAIPFPPSDNQPAYINKAKSIKSKKKEKEAKDLKDGKEKKKVYRKKPGTESLNNLVPFPLVLYLYIFRSISPPKRFPSHMYSLLSSIYRTKTGCKFWYEILSLPLFHSNLYLLSSPIMHHSIQTIYIVRKIAFESGILQSRRTSYLWCVGYHGERRSYPITSWSYRSKRKRRFEPLEIR